MKTKLLSIMAACAALAACSKTVELSPVDAPDEKANLSIGLEVRSKAGLQTGDEVKVSGIQVFVFKGHSLDAYKNATSDEIAKAKVELSCTQGDRDVWVLVNAPDLSSVTSSSVLSSSVSRLSADNASDKFVMVGRAEGEKITAIYSKTVEVDRIVSRIRLYQIRRNMWSESMKSLDFKITRVFLTNAADNACYDIFTPAVPQEYIFLNKVGETLSFDVPFVYDKAKEPSTVQDGSSYGNAYADAGSQAAHTFYTYPCTEGCTKLVVEVLLDGNYYTYPVPLGEIGSNKTYDIKMLTITRAGNPSDGDDVIDPEENEDIVPASASISITVNDWTPILTFGGEYGVKEGNIEI